jgi:type IV conjugative transfer system protein TraE
MERRTYQSQLYSALAARQFWAVTTLAMALANGGLVSYLVFYGTQSTTVFLTPNIEKPFKVVNGRYSASYIADVASWFAALGLTYTPNNYTGIAKLFLDHTDPRAHGAMRTHFVAERERIQDRGESSAFFIKNIEVCGDAAAVSGHRRIYVGARQVHEVEQTWGIRLATHTDGLVRLLIFKETTVDELCAPDNT